MANYATSALKLSDTYVNTLPYNVCSVAAGTAAKTVAAGSFSLETGAMVVVKFTNTNTAANPTLNVSSTGAKAIYYKGAAITASYLKANYVYAFIYNGTQWDLVGEIDTTVADTDKKTSSADTSSKIFLIGATTQSSSGQTTYSHDTAYVGTDGCLYSNSEKVATQSSLAKKADLVDGRVPSDQLPPSDPVSLNSLNNLTSFIIIPAETYNNWDVTIWHPRDDITPEYVCDDQYVKIYFPLEEDGSLGYLRGTIGDTSSINNSDSAIRLFYPTLLYDIDAYSVEGCEYYNGFTILSETEIEIKQSYRPISLYVERR